MMSITENYRSSNDYKEILRILQNSGNDQENFLWQSYDSLKKVIPMSHLEIDFVSREVVAFYDSSVHVLDDQRPLFTKLDFRGCVFKVESFKVEKNLVRFSFPKMVKTIELRGHSRHRFSPNKEKLVCLKLSRTGNRNSDQELYIRVLDISYCGLGLIISDFNHSFFNQNRTVWLTQIGHHKLLQPIEGEVLYMNEDFDVKFQRRKQKHKKIGLKLFSKIPEPIFENFIE
jgi:hypothetical protein